MAKTSAKSKEIKRYISKSRAPSTCEREQSRFRAGRTQREPAKGKCIHELFREQAERTPEAAAVIYKGREMSYRELDDRSSQVAHFLRELGVRREALVAICLDRSPELIVGLLGILKAGGAYVPLDPNYPTERLAFMLEDTQASVLLTDKALRARFSEPNARVAYLGGNWENFRHCSTNAPDNVVTPTNLAYVIYTSGSTGKPKGVMIEQAGVVNLVYEYRALYGIKEGMRISQTAAASFDAMGAELWPTVLYGASLCITPADVRVDPQLLQRWLIDERISIAFATTVIAERLLALPWPEEDMALRILRFGGERFRGKPAGRHYPFRIFNEYGPTEDSVWTTVAEVLDESGSEANIGRPFANHRVYVLDSNQNPVPIGDTGELCIAGIGVARGYLNRRELTEEKFITKQLPNRETERLYRTGDLGRYLSDGTLEFLGRIDDQVKIRGFRVEPAEIETVLNRHADVQECVVIARENPLGDRQLIAYVVVKRSLDTEPAKSLTGNEATERRQPLEGHLDQELAPKLQRYLSDRLPSYMVPSALVFLDRLPLTPNGKLDRRALIELRLPTHPFVEPQTPLQRKLAQIWQGVLGVERVGLTDDFFELGGDSLSVVHAISEIEGVLGKRIPLATLLQASTLEKLAEILQAENQKLLWSLLVPIQPQGTRPPFFAVHTLSGEVMFYRALALRLGEDQPFYGIQSEGLDGGPIRNRSMATIAHRYIDEIRRVQPHGSYYIGGYCIGGLVAFEMAQQLRAAGEEVACLALIDPDKLEPYRRPTLEERIRLALDEAARLSPTEKLRYLTRRITGKVKWELAHVREAADDLMQPVYQALKKRVGRIALTVEPYKSPVGRMLARAQSEYQPRKYPGRITLFCTAASDDGQFVDDRGWNGIAEGGVQIYEIPGEHQAVFEPPNISAWASKLDACLRASVSREAKS
jgi:amino acid adenylation domain-containing protein